MKNKNVLLKFKSSSKLADQLLLLPSVLSVIVFTTEFYSSNPDLKNFTKKVLNIEYKDYLFKSRTTLYARIIKDFYINGDSDKQEKIINNILMLTEHSETKPKKKTIRQKSTRQQKIINEWRQVINPNDNI